MKQPDVMKIYERWLGSTGVNHNYTERMGALAVLLWLKAGGLLKVDKREWVGLTDEDRSVVIEQWRMDEGKPAHLCKAIEAKLKEKNT